MTRIARYLKLLVCGSRHFTDRELFNKTLDEIHAVTPILQVIHGGASGADSMSWGWAISRNQGCCDEQQLNCWCFPAKWKELGRAAGPIRNKQMLVEGKPDMVIAFRGPNSRGTQNMINQATAAGVPVKIVNIPGTVPDVADILRKAGYGVVEGKDAVLKKIQEIK